MLERGAYTQARNSGNVQSCITGVVGPPDPDSPLVTLYAKKSFPPGLNTSRYDGVDDLLAKAATRRQGEARTGRCLHGCLKKSMTDVAGDPALRRPAVPRAYRRGAGLRAELPVHGQHVPRLAARLTWCSAISAAASGQLVVAVVGIVTVAFFLMRAIPGDPAIYMLGDFATTEALATLRAQPRPRPAGVAAIRAVPGQRGARRSRRVGRRPGKPR